jgi:hypothetical protein
VQDELRSAMQVRRFKMPARPRLRHAYWVELLISKRGPERLSRRSDQPLRRRWRVHYRRRPSLPPARGRRSHRWDCRRRDSWMTSAASANSTGHEHAVAERR